jgi:hypothetical protein
LRASFSQAAPKILRFLCVFAPLTPQMSEKERFWNALEAKVGARCGQNVAELWIAKQHSPFFGRFFVRFPVGFGQPLNPQGSPPTRANSRVPKPRKALLSPQRP